MDIIREDMGAIYSRVVEQIKIIWEECRAEILQTRGLDLLAKRKEELRDKIAELREELHQIEDELSPVSITVHQAIELGGHIDKWDKPTGANFFGIPVVSQLDYEIVQMIKEKVDTEAPAKYLSDLGKSALREITMAGTFEEAHKVYQDFYSLDFRKYGVDIPPRLEELAEAKGKGTEFMLGYTEKPKELPEAEEKEDKSEEHDPNYV
jgi:hypothetical protein